MTVQAKKTVKSAKATKNEFDRVMKDVEKENQVLKAPNSKALFASVGLFAAGAPLILFVTNVFVGKVREHIAVYVTVILLAAVVLAHSYASLAKKTTKHLLTTREPIEGQETNLKSVIVDESTQYSLFAVNSLYLVFFLFSIAYVLPVYQLSEYVNFSVASILSSLLVIGLVALKAL